LIVFGLLYVAAMLIGVALLALVIQAVRSPVAPMPTSTPLPAAPLPVLTVTPVPTRSSATATATRRPTVTALPIRTATAQPVCHMVQWGETLSEIAWDYNITVAALKRANGIPGWNDRIFQEQCLTIP
jgi:LysM repeat protein